MAFTSALTRVEPASNVARITGETPVPHREEPGETPVSQQEEPGETVVPHQGQAKRPASVRPGHMPIGEAIRRVLNSELYQGKRNREAARAWLRRLIRENERPELVVQDGGKTWIHPSLHPALDKPPDKTIASDAIDQLTADQRARVLCKVRAIQGLKQFRDALRLGKCASRERFAAERVGQYTYNSGSGVQVLSFSAESLAIWEGQFDQAGVNGLAVDKRRRGPKPDSGPDEEAAKLYWGLRFEPKRYSIAFCHRWVEQEAARKGWKWFPSLAACQMWDLRTRNEGLLTLMQRGEAAYNKKYGAYIELDPESFAPAECWVGDDHTLDLWVIAPNGKVIRPCLSVWQDWRSRTIVGWAMVPDGNQHSLLYAFRKGYDDHGHIPAKVIVDNGKNFTSYAWMGESEKTRCYRKAGELKLTLAGVMAADGVEVEDATENASEGIYALTGINVSRALPYNPNGKARLERFFRTLKEQLVQGFESYCGGRPDERPEPSASLVRKAVPWDDFLKALEQFIQTYNNRPHGAADMRGLSPVQMLSLAPQKRVLSDATRRFLLQAWHRPVKVGRQGVRVTISGAPGYYGHIVCKMGQVRHGQQVRISYDPADVSKVHVWTMDYQYLFEATRNGQCDRSVTDEAVREEIRKRRRQTKTLKEAAKVNRWTLKQDPVQAAAETLAFDAARNRLPDPEHPDGAPSLVPVQSPLQVPDDLPMRKAVGAEGGDYGRSRRRRGGGLSPEIIDKIQAMTERETQERQSREMAQLKRRTLAELTESWAPAQGDGAEAGEHKPRVQRRMTLREIMKLDEEEYGPAF